MNTINAERLHQEINNRNNVILDVLPEEHYQQGHIPGAISAPLDNDDFLEEARSAVQSPAQRVVVYCANKSCDLSPRAAKKLEANGFKDVVDFEGGIEAWKDAGYPVQRGAAARAAR